MNRKLLVMLLCILFCMSAWCADGDVFTAKSIEGVDMVFKVVSEEAKTCQVEKQGNRVLNHEGSLTIPSSANGYSVISLSYAAFKDCKNMTSIEVPNSVTIIGEAAFENCSSLSSANLGNGVTSLGRYVFSGCASLTTIKLPNSVTTVGSNLFNDCINLVSVTLSQNLTSLSNAQFKGCTKLPTVVIPNSVKAIGNGTFRECSSLTEIVMPNSIESLGTNAFYKCQALTSVILSEKLKEIPEGTFYGCSSLSSVEIPSNVEKIGTEAFYCAHLTSISIPDAVKEIGKSAFRSCSYLKSVTIGTGLKSLGEEAFMYCTELKTFFCNAETVPRYGSSFFENTRVDDKGLLVVPDELKDSYLNDKRWSGSNYIKGFAYIVGKNEYAQQYSTGKSFTAKTVEGVEMNFVVSNADARTVTVGTNRNDVRAIDTSYGGPVTIPSSVLWFDVTGIRDFAFESCTGMTEVSIPKSVADIGLGVFGLCSNLIKITVDDDNPSFCSPEDCNAVIKKGLAPILIAACQRTKIPDMVKKIGKDAFYGCDIPLVSVPNSVETIADDAFWMCKKLTNIYIGSGVDSIGKNVFGYCEELHGIRVSESNRIYDSRDNCNAIIETASNKMVLGCASTSIPSSVAVVGQGCFNYFTGITSIDIPGTVKEIEEDAFWGCSNLKTIYIGSVGVIRQHAFYGLNADAVIFSGGGTTFEKGSFSSCSIGKVVIRHADEFIKGKNFLNAFESNVKNYAYLLASKNASAMMGSVMDFRYHVPFVTISAESQTRTYGSHSAVSYKADRDGYKGEPLVTCEADETSPVGTYTIHIEKGTLEETRSNWFELIDGTLTVKKAPLSVGVGGYTRKQGEENPKFNFVYEGFKNGETDDVLTKKPTASTTATKESEPGNYVVTVSGAEAQNYEIEHINGVLHVTPADPVVITAKSYTRKYGDANPVFEYTTIGVPLEGTPEISCEATVKSPVGTYDIVVKQGSVTNYNVTYVAGTLTITKAPLSVKAGAYTKKQGDPLPEFTLTYEGFKNNETEAVLTKKPTATTTATKESAPGEYVVTVSGGEATNYELSYTNGKLIVTEADAVIVTAKSYTRKYGDANPTFEYTSEGATLVGTPEIICEATATSPVGTYPIKIKKGSVMSYNVTYVEGTLTITKAPLSVKVEDVTREQYQENPEFVITYSGWKVGDDENALIKKPTATTTATKDSPVGEYEIVVSGGEAENYELTYENGTLTVIESTGIATISITQPVDVYMLHGHKVRTKATTLDGLPKGIYIVNGHKVIVK